jgi:CelD/BcsL family acetyltransferase involved in cellulose biosynthesis
MFNRRFWFFPDGYSYGKSLAKHLRGKSVNRMTDTAEFSRKPWNRLREEFVCNVQGVHVRFHDNLDDAEDIWKQFQQVAATTLYNTFEWAKSWQRHVGLRIGAAPCIAVGRNSAGDIQFILPFQKRRASGVQIVEWHGYPDLNYGYGLFDKAFLHHAEAYFAQALPDILAALGNHDVIHLHDMPVRLSGYPHPLRRHFNMHAANLTFSLKLDADYETVYRRKRVAESRRANQRKDNRLLELGEIRFFTPATPDERQKYIRQMLVQKTHQLAERGIHGVFGTAEAQMMVDLAQASHDRQPLMQLHVLTLNGETLAITYGGVLDSTYWFYVSSLSPHAGARKFSPGDHALRRTIEACCEEQLAVFDFGVGDAEYKRGWADKVTPLYMMLRANTLKGLVWVTYESSRLRMKRFIKETPSLMRLASGMRRLVRGRAAA